MISRHPSEADLALLAGGDCPWLQGLRLRRHVARCGDCRDTFASFGELRTAVREAGLPGLTVNDPAWDRLAGEMRANIRLGLAAGECVGNAPRGAGGEASDVPHRGWVPRFAVGMASVILLAGAGIFLRGLLPHADLSGVAHSAVLQSSGTGVEVRTDSGSMTLLNHGDEAGDQTVTSQGAVSTSSFDSNTGTVTITSAYVE